jgi:hypothetical protein
MKIRARGFLEIVEALGATPVGMSQGETSRRFRRASSRPRLPVSKAQGLKAGENDSMPCPNLGIG